MQQYFKVQNIFLTSDVSTNQIHNQPLCLHTLLK